MPTGYTAELYEGKDQTFEEYAMSCARAFGALVTMRDDPNDAEIPEKFEPSPYHATEIEKEHRRVKEVESWGPKTAQAEADIAFEKQDKAHKEAVKKRAALRTRYEAMLEKARAYKAPTPDHEGLAKFLVTQLEESLEFDCAGRVYPEAPTPIAGADYKAEQIRKAKVSIVSHERYLAEEQERADTRTEWVRQLRESLVPERAAA